MSLSKTLKNQGYDLIDGPTRNHTINQLWTKDPWDKVEVLYDHVDHAFLSPVDLIASPVSGLDLVYSHKNSFNFNIGMSVAKLELDALGIDGLSLTTTIKKGKSVEISYSGSVSKEIPLGKIQEFFSAADYHHNNPMLLKNLNGNNIIFISGLLSAKNLRIEIQNDVEFDLSIEGKINEAIDGKLEAKLVSKKRLQLTSSGNTLFPVAVKAHRLRYRKGEFIDAELITDNRDIF
ncbi:hypothetical protein [Algoriphagus namhaensis]